MPFTPQFSPKLLEKKRYEEIDAEIEKLRAAKDSSDTRYKIAKLVRTYPNSKIAPTAQYELAGIYGEKLNDKAKMREAYRMFILLFPDHDLVGEALRRLREGSK